MRNVKVRIGSALAVIAVCAVGCVPQPTACTSTIEFDTAKYCAAGPIPVSGSSGWFQELTVGGGVRTDHAAGSATLYFGTFASFGPHGLGGVDFGFTRTSSTSPPDFGVGVYHLSADPDNGLSFRFEDGSNFSGGTVLTATTGVIRITKLRLTATSDPDFMSFDRLSATFEVDTEKGHLTGAVSIGHD